MAYTRLFRCSNEKGKTRRLPKYWIYSLGNFLITIKYKLFLKLRITLLKEGMGSLKEEFNISFILVLEFQKKISIYISQFNSYLAIAHEMKILLTPI